MLLGQPLMVNLQLAVLPQGLAVLRSRVEGEMLRVLLGEVGTMSSLVVVWERDPATFSSRMNSLLRS